MQPACEVGRPVELPTCDVDQVLGGQDGIVQVGPGPARFVELAVVQLEAGLPGRVLRSRARLKRGMAGCISATFTASLAWQDQYQSIWTKRDDKGHLGQVLFSNLLLIFGDCCLQHDYMSVTAELKHPHIGHTNAVISSHLVAICLNLP